MSRLCSTFLACTKRCEDADKKIQKYINQGYREDLG